MAKLTILVATLAAVLLMVDASIYRTTVVIDEENRSQRCQGEMRAQDNLRHCMEYMMEQSRSRWSDQRGHFDMCCRQLESMSQECRCENLEEAMQMRREQFQRQRMSMSEAMQTARRLPTICRLQTRECSFRSPYAL
ncbi:hypothetical protein Tsubulata_005481 [Turnera subulata]|uniref:Bifunctional inhibitor/plant lipid transfer protein/seed storage helical domain-containing protein n=1 Tax=Turnera subulata TaxID=218843 RepID=A0A9Q0FSD3_9ROSI|nr:hypothetical protein Tsubulata_005481 [Turnera subulata]